MIRLNPWKSALVITIFAVAMVTNVVSFVRSYRFIRTRRPSETPLQLRYWHRRWFISFAILYPVATTGTQITFAVLSWSQGGARPAQLMIAVLISSIFREVRRCPRIRVKG
jgi:hypothetical protein